MHAFVQPLRGSALHRLFGLTRKRARINANRHRRDDDRVAVDDNRLAGLMRHIQEVQQAVLEIMKMLARLKADDIVGAHHAQQGLGGRQHGKQACRHEGHMQKEADTVFHAKRAQGHAERDQMIIMHPDQVGGLEQRHKRLRISAVDVEIGFEVLAIEFEQARLEMQQRPEHRIGEADIEALVILVRQIDRREIELARVLDLGGDAGLGGNFAAPAEPEGATA